MASTVLLTGGAGYIGSHTAVELLGAGHSVVIVDNLANSSRVAVDRVRELGGGSVSFHEVDVLDRASLDDVFAQHDIDAVVHFAGLKAVGESVNEPLRYYRTNVTGTINLIEIMVARAVHRLVFSSSCTVYGHPESVPLTEDSPLVPASPYGRSKLMVEQVLADAAATDERWRIALLRYFNPVGAHQSGRIGEDPVGVPNCLMPFAMQVAVGRRERLRVFGDDWPTQDGTGVRDYLHVVDLALGHLAALDRLDDLGACTAINLGTGQGHSVLDVVRAASAAAGREIPYEIAPRRPGDVAEVWCEPKLAESLLGWRATRTLDDMCADHWRWQRDNPHGYR